MPVLCLLACCCCYYLLLCFSLLCRGHLSLIGNQSIDQSTNQPSIHSFSQSINQSINQSPILPVVTLQPFPSHLSFESLLKPHYPSNSAPPYPVWKNSSSSRILRIVYITTTRRHSPSLSFILSSPCLALPCIECTGLPAHSSIYTHNTQASHIFYLARHLPPWRRATDMMSPNVAFGPTCASNEGRPSRAPVCTMMQRNQVAA